MAVMNYLAGGPWTCSANLPAMGGQPAHTEQMTLTFDVLPGNIMHDHVASADYAGDDYFGYMAQNSLYWTTSADSMGSHGSSTSTDAKTFTGTTSMGGQSMSMTSTYTKVSPTSITSHEVVTAGGKSMSVDSSCNR
ncbi:MAG: hypothetical protein ABIZ82_07965 [Candidatus Tumulicola sp.]